MPEQGLDGNELLRRSIRPDDVIVQSTGWKLSSSAFNDKNKKPSVDRARIRPNAADSRLGEDNGIVELLTEDVRSGVEIVFNPTAPPENQRAYRVNVFARPILPENPEGLPANPAHAQIECAPEVTGTHFKKVKDKLCRLAEKRGLTIVPTGVSVGALGLRSEALDGNAAQ